MVFSHKYTISAMHILIIDDLEEVVEFDVEIIVIDEVLRQVREKGIHGILQQGSGAFLFNH
jgi:hypothetical protein